MNNSENIIVKLNGRLANQMFEWAFAKVLSQNSGKNVLIDDSEETLKLDCFKVFENIKTVEKSLKYKLFRKIIPFRNLRNKLTALNFDKMQNIQEECFCTFQQNLLEINKPCYIKGFFQSEKYFKNIREDLLKDFSLNVNLNEQNKKMLEKIQSTNSVSIHFRRGDYTKKRVADKYGSCSVEYYKNAVEYISNNNEKTITLFIFSDDIDWVRNNVKFDCETFYVDINSAKQGYFDLELMKNCKHNIIANSSFSWWGAWLNENESKIVVAPKWWMKDINTTDENIDIIPEGWIILDNR